MYGSARVRLNTASAHHREIAALPDFPQHRVRDGHRFLSQGTCKRETVFSVDRLELRHFSLMSRFHLPVPAGPFQECFILAVQPELRVDIPHLVILILIAARIIQRNSAGMFNVAVRFDDQFPNRGLQIAGFCFVERRQVQRQIHQIHKIIAEERSLFRASHDSERFGLASAFLNRGIPPGRKGLRHDLGQFAKHGLHFIHFGEICHRKCQIRIIKFCLFFLIKSFVIINDLTRYRNGIIGFIQLA